MVHLSNDLPQLRYIFVAPPALLVTKRPGVLPCRLPDNLAVLLNHLRRCWAGEKVEIKSSAQHSVLYQ